MLQKKRALESYENSYQTTFNPTKTQLKIKRINQIVLTLRGDKAIKQAVSDLRTRFDVHNRPFTKEDFYLICKDENINVYDNLPLITAGFYFVVKRRVFIAISSRLKGQKFLATAFHELGHHFFHRHDLHKQKHYFRRRQAIKSQVKEAQANFFSKLLLGGVCNNG